MWPNDESPSPFQIYEFWTAVSFIKGDLFINMIYIFAARYLFIKIHGLFDRASRYDNSDSQERSSRYKGQILTKHYS